MPLVQSEFEVDEGVLFIKDSFVFDFGEELHRTGEGLDIIYHPENPESFAFNLWTVTSNPHISLFAKEQKAFIALEGCA